MFHCSKKLKKYKKHIFQKKNKKFQKITKLYFLSFEKQNQTISNNFDYLSKIFLFFLIFLRVD